MNLLKKVFLGLMVLVSVQTGFAGSGSYAYKGKPLDYKLPPTITESGEAAYGTITFTDYEKTGWALAACKEYRKKSPLCRWRSDYRCGPCIGLDRYSAVLDIFED